ncbi:iron-sulfur cluster insertion protein ErpA [Enterobacteriaceae endosymbiont of Plateumaris consimilis]|uniref:iron-sulfur cluster insertion protein ErpA n=1 Tax=Enterobacteriaceae endosymbiont of Plateumaris consimilis TaxID=2675794 RepID=UPI00144921B6|nr:iron-sulfur cluster insertion protein ErpA [Enterobacteriaceae endosymbiont of Plateumaris consimilis]QJC28483.1 iron-sulfur cluster insertion protein ErpA [Enterobacteriaceae endosymbiont of Plateumaris consimilis]
MRNNLINTSIKITKKAIKKIKYFISKKKNKKMKFRIFIIGGGCNGFKYEFILDEKISKKDIIIKLLEFSIIIDSISMQYLFGITIDYIENIEGSKFIIRNPQAKTTCNCGFSFDI